MILFRNIQTKKFIDGETIFVCENCTHHDFGFLIIVTWHQFLEIDHRDKKRNDEFGEEMMLNWVKLKGKRPLPRT